MWEKERKSEREIKKQTKKKVKTRKRKRGVSREKKTKQKEIRKLFTFPKYFESTIVTIASR